VRTADFDYELPPGSIAQAPPPRRSDARLLVLRRQGGGLEHRRFTDLPDLLAPGDLVVVNDTRVLPARLQARRPTGGRVELLLLHPRDPAAEPTAAAEWVALARPARRVRLGQVLPLVEPGGTTPGDAAAEVVGLLGEGRVELVLRGVPAEGALALLRRFGQVPLPPYIHRSLPDPERYQTVYARAAGSAAAPTAGLHFTAEVLAALQARGVQRTSVTLHVGLGTFRPVLAERAEEHRMHAEWCEVRPAAAEALARARARGGRVLAVGTTAVRTLESRVEPDGSVRPGSGWTDLYILPGRAFRAVDALLTNFHLPRSTLLMLVAAFGGREPVLAAYAEAVRSGYRFFSFGDAMLVL